MLGLGGGIDGDDCNGRFLTRPNAMAAAAAAVNYGRPQHPYAGKDLGQKGFKYVSRVIFLLQT